MSNDLEQLIDLIGELKDEVLNEREKRLRLSEKLDRTIQQIKITKQQVARTTEVITALLTPLPAEVSDEVTEH